MTDLVDARERVRKKQQEYFEWFGISKHEKYIHEYNMLQELNIDGLFKLEQMYDHMCQLGAMIKLAS
jgi:hypothetical protein